jgi:hypothetical protein
LKNRTRLLKQVQQQKNESRGCGKPPDNPIDKCVPPNVASRRPDGAGVFVGSLKM